MLKKIDPPTRDEVIDVLIELRASEDREDLLAVLDELGAVKVQELAGAFISVRLPASQIATLRRRADIHIKRPSQFR